MKQGFTECLKFLKFTWARELILSTVVFITRWWIIQTGSDTYASTATPSSCVSKVKANWNIFVSTIIHCQKIHLCPFQCKITNTSNLDSKQNVSQNSNIIVKIKKRTIIEEDLYLSNKLLSKEKKMYYPKILRTFVCPKDKININSIVKVFNQEINILIIKE